MQMGTWAVGSRSYLAVAVVLVTVVKVFKRKRKEGVTIAQARSLWFALSTGYQKTGGYDPVIGPPKVELLHYLFGAIRLPHASGQLMSQVGIACTGSKKGR